MDSAGVSVVGRYAHSSSNDAVQPQELSCFADDSTREGRQDESVSSPAVTQPWPPERDHADKASTTRGSQHVLSNTEAAAMDGVLLIATTVSAEERRGSSDECAREAADAVEASSFGAAPRALRSDSGGGAGQLRVKSAGDIRGGFSSRHPHGEKGLTLKDLVNTEELSFILHHPPLKHFTRNHSASEANADAEAGENEEERRMSRRDGREAAPPRPLLPPELFTHPSVNPHASSSWRRGGGHHSSSSLPGRHPLPPAGGDGFRRGVEGRTDGAARGGSSRDAAAAALPLANHRSLLSGAASLPSFITSPEDLCGEMDFSEYFFSCPAPVSRNAEGARRGSGSESGARGSMAGRAASAFSTTTAMGRRRHSSCSGRAKEEPSAEEEEAQAKAHYARTGFVVYDSPANHVPAPDVMRLAMCDLEAVRRSLAAHTHRWRRADMLGRFKVLVARSIREEERLRQLEQARDESLVRREGEATTGDASGAGLPALPPSGAPSNALSPEPEASPSPSTLPASTGRGSTSAAEDIIRNSPFLNGPDVIPSGIPVHHLQRARAQLIWEYDANVGKELQHLQRLKFREAQAAAKRRASAKPTTYDAPSDRTSVALTAGGADAPSSTQAAREHGRVSFLASVERYRREARDLRSGGAGVVQYHRCHRRLLPMLAPRYLTDSHIHSSTSTSTGTGGGGGRQASVARSGGGGGRYVQEPPQAPPAYERAWDVDLSDDLAVALAGFKQFEANQRARQRQRQREHHRSDAAQRDGDADETMDEEAATDTAPSSAASGAWTDWERIDLADEFHVPLPAFVYVVSRLLFQLHYAHLFPPGLFARGLVGDVWYYPEEAQRSPAHYARFVPTWRQHIRRHLCAMEAKRRGHDGAKRQGAASLWKDVRLFSGMGSPHDEVLGTAPDDAEGSAAAEEFAQAACLLQMAAAASPAAGDDVALPSSAPSASHRSAEGKDGSHAQDAPPPSLSPATPRAPSTPTTGRCYRAYLQCVAQLPIVCEEVQQMMSRCRLAAYELFSHIDTTQRGEVRWSDFSDALIERAEVVHHRTLAEDAATRVADATKAFADGSRGSGGAAGVTASSVFDRYLVESLPQQLQRAGYTGHVVEIRHSGSLVLLEGPFDIAVCDGAQLGSIAFKIAVRSYEDIVADVAAGAAQADARESTLRAAASTHVRDRLGQKARSRRGGGDAAAGDEEGWDLAESAALARRPWRQNQKMPAIFIKYEDGKRLNELAAMEVIQQLSGRRKKRQYRQRRKREEQSSERARRQPAPGEGASAEEGSAAVNDTTGAGGDSEDDSAKDGEDAGMCDAQQFTDQRSKRVFLQDAVMLTRPLFKGMPPILLTLHTDLSLRLYRTQHTLQAVPECAMLRFRETITAMEWAGGCAASDTQLKSLAASASASSTRHTSSQHGQKDARALHEEEVDWFSTLMQTRVFRDYFILGTRTGELKLLHVRPFLLQVPVFHGEDAAGLSRQVVYDIGRSTLIGDAAKYMATHMVGSEQKHAEEGTTAPALFHTSIVTSIRTATKEADGDDGDGAGGERSRGARGGWNVLSASLDGVVCLSRLVPPLSQGTVPTARADAANTSNATTSTSGRKRSGRASQLLAHSAHPELRPVARIKVCGSGLRRAISIPHAQAIVAQTVSHQVFMYSESSRSNRLELFDPAAPHFAPLVAMTVVDALDQLITADCSGFVKVWSISRAMPLTSFYALSQEAQSSLQGTIDTERDDNKASGGGASREGDGEDGAGHAGHAGQKARLHDETDVNDPATRDDLRMQQRQRILKRKGLDDMKGAGIDFTDEVGAGGIAVYRPFYLKPLSSFAYDHTTKRFFALGMHNAVICTFVSGQGGVKAHTDRVRFLGIGRTTRLVSLQGEEERGPQTRRESGGTATRAEPQRDGHDHSHGNASKRGVDRHTTRPANGPPSREWLLLTVSTADGRLWGVQSGAMLMGIRAANPAYDVLAAERLSCLRRSHRSAENDGASVALGMLRAAGEDVGSGAIGGDGGCAPSRRMPCALDDVLQAVDNCAQRRRRERVLARFHGSSEAPLPSNDGPGTAAHRGASASSHSNGKPPSLLAMAAAGHHSGGGYYYGAGSVGGGAASNLSDTTRNANAKGGGGDITCACWGHQERSFLYALSTGDVRMHRTDSGRLIKTFLTTPPTLEDVLDAAIQFRGLFLTKANRRSARAPPPPASVSTALSSPFPPTLSSTSNGMALPSAIHAPPAARPRSGGAGRLGHEERREGEGEGVCEGEVDVFAASTASGGSTACDMKARNDAVMSRAMIKAGMLRAQKNAGSGAGLLPSTTSGGGGGGGAGAGVASSNGGADTDLSFGEALGVRRGMATNLEKIEAVATLLQRLLLDHFHSGSDEATRTSGSSANRVGGGGPTSASSLQAQKTSFHLEAVSMHCLENTQDLVVVYADGVVRYFPLLGHSLTAHRLVIPEYLVSKCVYYLRGGALSAGIGTVAAAMTGDSLQLLPGSARDSPRQGSGLASPAAALAGGHSHRIGAGEEGDGREEEDGAAAAVWAVLRPASPTSTGGTGRSHQRPSSSTQAYAQPSPPPSVSTGSFPAPSASPPRGDSQIPPLAAAAAAAAKPAGLLSTSVEPDAVSLVAVSAPLQLVCVVLVNGTAAVLDVGNAGGANGNSSSGSGRGGFGDTFPVPSSSAGGAASASGFGGGALLHQFTTSEEVTAAAFLGAYPCLVLADRCRRLHFYLVRGASLLALHEDFLREVVQDRRANPLGSTPTSSSSSPSMGSPAAASRGGSDEKDREMLSTRFFTFTMPSTQPSSAHTAGERASASQAARSGTASVGGGGQPTSLYFDALYATLYVGTKDGYLRSFLLRKLIAALDLRPLSVAAAHVSVEVYNTTLKAQQQQETGEAVRNTLFLLFGVTAEDVARHVGRTQQRRSHETGSSTALGSPLSTVARSEGEEQRLAPPPPPLSPPLWHNSLSWVYRTCRELFLQTRDTRQTSGRRAPSSTHRTRTRSSCPTRKSQEGLDASAAASEAPPPHRAALESTQTFFLTSTHVADGGDAHARHRGSTDHEDNVMRAAEEERDDTGDGRTGPSRPRRTRTALSMLQGDSPSPNEEGRPPLSLRTATLPDVLLATAVMHDATRLLRLKHQQGEDAHATDAERERDAAAAAPREDAGENPTGGGLRGESRSITSSMGFSSILAAADRVERGAGRSVEEAYRLGHGDVTRIRRWIASALQAEREGATSAFPLHEMQQHRQPASALAASEGRLAGKQSLADGLALTSQDLVRSVEDEVLGKSMRRFRAGLLGASILSSHHPTNDSFDTDTIATAVSSVARCLPHPHPITSQWVEPLFNRHATFMSANAPLALLTPAATLERARRERVARERLHMEARLPGSRTAHTSDLPPGAASRNPTGGTVSPRIAGTRSASSRLSSTNTTAPAAAAGVAAHAPTPSARTVRDVLRQEGNHLCADRESDGALAAGSCSAASHAVGSVTMPDRGRREGPGAVAEQEDGAEEERREADDAMRMADHREHGMWDEFVEGTVPRLVMDVFRRPGRVLRDVAKLSEMDLSVTAITSQRNGFVFVGSADGTVSLWTPYAGARIDSVCAIAALPAAIRTLGESVKRQFRRVREAIVGQRQRAAYETDGTLGRNAQEGQERIKFQIKAMLLQHQVSEKKAKDQLEYDLAMQQQLEEKGRDAEAEGEGDGCASGANSPRTRNPLDAAHPVRDDGSHEGGELVRGWAELEDRRDVLLFTLGIAGEAEMAAKHLHLTDLCFLPLRMADLAEVDAFAAGTSSFVSLAYGAAVDVAVRRLFREVCGREFDAFFRERPPPPCSPSRPARARPVSAASMPSRLSFSAGVVRGRGGGHEGEEEGEGEAAEVETHFYRTRRQHHQRLLQSIACPTTSETAQLRLCHEYCMSEAALEERWELAQAAEVAEEMLAAAELTVVDVVNRQTSLHRRRASQLMDSHPPSPSSASASSLLMTGNGRTATRRHVRLSTPPHRHPSRPAPSFAPASQPPRERHPSLPFGPNGRTVASPSLVMQMDGLAARRVSTMMQIGNESKRVSQDEQGGRMAGLPEDLEAVAVSETARMGSGSTQQERPARPRTASFATTRSAPLSSESRHTPSMCVATPSPFPLALPTRLGRPPSGEQDRTSDTGPSAGAHPREAHGDGEGGEKAEEEEEEDDEITGWKSEAARAAVEAEARQAEVWLRHAAATSLDQPRLLPDVTAFSTESEGEVEETEWGTETSDREEDGGDGDADDSLAGLREQSTPMGRGRTPLHHVPLDSPGEVRVAHDLSPEELQPLVATDTQAMVSTVDDETGNQSVADGAASDASSLPTTSPPALHVASNDGTATASGAAAAGAVVAGGAASGALSPSSPASRHPLAHTTQTADRFWQDAADSGVMAHDLSAAGGGLRAAAVSPHTPALLCTPVHGSASGSDRDRSGSAVAAADAESVEEDRAVLLTKTFQAASARAPVAATARWARGERGKRFLNAAGGATAASPAPSLLSPSPSSPALSAASSPRLRHWERADHTPPQSHKRGDVREEDSQSAGQRSGGLVGRPPLSHRAQPLPVATAAVHSGVSFDGQLARWQLDTKPAGMRATLTSTGRATRVGSGGSATRPTSAAAAHASGGPAPSPSATFTAAPLPSLVAPTGSRPGTGLRSCASLLPTRDRSCSPSSSSILPTRAGPCTEPASSSLAAASPSPTGVLQPLSPQRPSTRKGHSSRAARDAAGLQLRVASPEAQQFRQQQSDDSDAPRRVVMLHLRPAADVETERRRQQMRRQRVSWREDVSDNPTQRVSKCCCVFHKKKLFGESSSDESDDSTSDDTDEDGGVAAAGKGSSYDDGAHEGHTDGCCAHAVAGEAGEATAPPPSQKKHRHKRPPCTKEHCYCGTTFH